MGTGWKNDDKNKSVSINPNVKAPSAGRADADDVPMNSGFNQGRAAANQRTGRDTATVTTNRKK